MYYWTDNEIVEHFGFVCESAGGHFLCFDPNTLIELWMIENDWDREMRKKNFKDSLQRSRNDKNRTNEMLSWNQ